METVSEYNKTWCVLVTIDVRNAFNMGSYGLIMQKLRNKRIFKYLVNFISGYLKNRRIQIAGCASIPVGIEVTQGYQRSRIYTDTVTTVTFAKKEDPELERLGKRRKR